jgi:hypothetical protein
VHQIKDKEKRKVVGMTKDLQQIIKNNEKRDKEKKDEWESQSKELRDLIAKYQMRLDKERRGELDEDAWKKLTDEERKKYYKKAQDLLKQIVDGFKEAVGYSDEYLYEDRHREIVNMYNQFPDWVSKYDDENFTDIFSISIMLAQLVRYSSIVKHTKDEIIPKVKVDLTEAKKKKMPLYIVKD